MGAGGHHGDHVTGPLTRVQPPEGTLPQPQLRQHVCREERTFPVKDRPSRVMTSPQSRRDVTLAVAVATERCLLEGFLLTVSQTRGVCCQHVGHVWTEEPLRPGH